MGSISATYLVWRGKRINGGSATKMLEDKKVSALIKEVKRRFIMVSPAFWNGGHTESYWIGIGKPT